MAWLNAHLRLIEWIVLGLAIAGSFYSGMHLQYLVERDRELKTVKVEQKQDKKDGDKVHAIRNKVSALPDGAAARELQSEWSRD